MQKPEINPAIDWELAIKLSAGKKDLAKELVQKLIDTLPHDQHTINQAFSENNWVLLRERVHHLHGAAAYCGVPKLKDTLKNLEKCLLSTTLVDLNEKMKAFNLAIEEVMQFSHLE